MNTRSRRCGAPTEEAGNSCPLRVIPEVAKVSEYGSKRPENRSACSVSHNCRSGFRVTDRLHPQPSVLCAVADNKPRTFSMTTHCGRSVIASAKIAHNPDLVPSLMPARFPAADTSRHGNPPHNTSIAGTSAQPTFVISPEIQYTGNPVPEPWTRLGQSRLCQTTSPPNTCWTAMSRPPAPLKRLPILIRRCNGRARVIRHAPQAVLDGMRRLVTHHVRVDGVAQRHVPADHDVQRDATAVITDGVARSDSADGLNPG